MSLKMTSSYIYQMLNLAAQVSEKLRRESLVDTIISKANGLSMSERLKIGDQVVSMVKNHNVKFLKVIVPHVKNEDSSEDEYAQESYTYLFPKDLYANSLSTLKSGLMKSCTCEHPDLSHQLCHVDTETEYEIWDAWYTNNNYRLIMKSALHIQALLDDPLTRCPYALLKDKRQEIINEVSTPESLGWIDAPNERTQFIEDGRYCRIYDTFDSTDDVNTLLQRYQSMLNDQTNIRTTINLLSYACTLISYFGTSDGYCQITINDFATFRYYIPYQRNAETLDCLRQFNDTEITTQGWNVLCRCGCKTIYHHGYLSPNIICKDRVDRDLNSKFVEKLVTKEELLSYIGNRCPFVIYDSNDSITNIFVN